MRVVQSAITTLDQYLEEAQRAKAAAEVERWRAELRPRVLRHFAARARTLTWSRALLKLVVEELYPDDLFTELVGNLDRVPARQWPRVIAIAVALPTAGVATDSRTSPDACVSRLPRLARNTAGRAFADPDHHAADSPARLAPVKALRFAPTPQGGAYGLDRDLGRALVPALT